MIKTMRSEWPQELRERSVWGRGGAGRARCLHRVARRRWLARLFGSVGEGDFRDGHKEEGEKIKTET